MKELLSVIITSYKRKPDIVLRAVNSVSAQTYELIEILIVDDNENESSYSQSLKKAFENTMKGVTYIKQDGNQGACAARNLGIKKAKGSFIGFLDDDDTWEPRKAELQLKKFEEAADTDVGMVFCTGNVVDTTTKPPTITDYYTVRLFQEELTHKEILRWDSIGSTSQAIIRRECFEKVGGFNPKLPARQDYEMWIRISSQYRVLGVKDKLFNHYQHDLGQITSNPKRALNGYKILYQIHKDEYDKDIRARINLLERMKKTQEGNNVVLYWYYQLLKWWFRLIERINKYI